jgi:hypothetical protein
MCFVQSIDQLADAAVNLNKWSSSKLTSWTDPGRNLGRGR